MSANSAPRPGSLLRVTVFSGCMLLLLIGAILAGIYATGRIVSDVRESRFYRLLGEYDFRYRQVTGAGQAALRQELDGLEQELTRLERRAEGVESWLSILKRRRQLAGLDPHYRKPYIQSSQRAALAFPYSAPIAAVAAAALVHDSAISREGETALRGYLPLLFDSRFAPIRLSLYVLLGDFAGPHRASSVLPELSGLLNDLPPGSAGQRQFQPIVADLAILKTIAGDTHGAVVDIWSGLAAASDAASPELIRLAAEFSYDFGDLLRSAELFSLLPDEAALGRQADALWLAGYDDSARAIWSIQAESPTALYNLALTAQTRAEAERLFMRLAGRAAGDASRDFGLIRYSRLFDAPRAIGILEAEKATADPTNILIELEILKRHTEVGEVARVIAETWMLVERFPDAEETYHWGSWYFDLQRSYAESAMLHSAATRRDFTGQWLGIYGALQHIRDGNLDAAQEALATTVASGAAADWTAHANLGRILEAHRAPRQALASYERALTALTESEAFSPGWQGAASRIYVRVAYCLRSLDRQDESRAALEQALELDPDNLRARVELSRM